MMEIDKLSEVSEETLDSPETFSDDQNLNLLENLTLSDNKESEVLEKKSRKRKSQVDDFEEVFVRGDRVIVDENQNPQWSNGNPVPHWIYTRRFYILNVIDDECEISLDLNSKKASGRIKSGFLKRV